MEPPRYRTLDGDEVELPLPMDRWVLVPRTLARFDPELAWALDYDDAPEPEDADPRLDFSAGALLVPVERWNERAELEPNLAPWSATVPDRSVFSSVQPVSHATSSRRDADTRSLAVRLAAFAARSIAFALAALPIAYVLGVGAWLWTLREGISGPDVSMGLILVGVAVLLAWLAGFAGTAGGPPPARPARGRMCAQLGV